MAIIRCPKCNSVRTEDAPAGNGWMLCRRCNHTWMHQEEEVAQSEPAKLKPSTTAVGSDPRKAVAEIIGSGDYSPGSVHDADTENVDPLTNRVGLESTDHLRPQTLESIPATGGLERLDGEPVASTPSSPADEPAEQEDSSEPSEPDSLGPIASNEFDLGVDLDADLPASNSSDEIDVQINTGGSQVAIDLFGTIEREIENERQNVDTMVGEVEKEHIDCPHCDHAFQVLADTPEVACPKCGNQISLTHRFQKVTGGDSLIGKEVRGCRVDRKIGEGGMGSVYHATQLSLDRSVAIKVLPPDLKHDRKFLRRFEQEAKSLARINHPNIMHVYDFGEEDSFGIYFMIMEFVDGLDLAEILRQKRKLPALDVLDCLRQSALGLQQADIKGVVHRDIKPDNLMVTAEGVWKVSDFGLAKQVDAMTQVTKAGIRVGTPAFMSPEQCDGKPLDYHSDMYSLGVTAYTALTGRLPFDGESPFAIMLKHKTQPPPSVRDRVADIPIEVDELVQRLMSKDPEDRGATWANLVIELEELIEMVSPGALGISSGKHRTLRTTEETDASPPESPAPSDPTALPEPRFMEELRSSEGLPPVPSVMFSTQDDDHIMSPESAPPVPASPPVPAELPPEVNAGTGSEENLPRSHAVGDAFDALLSDSAIVPAPTPPPTQPPTTSRRDAGGRPVRESDALRRSSGIMQSPIQQPKASSAEHPASPPRRRSTTPTDDGRSGSESERVAKRERSSSVQHVQRQKEISDLVRDGDQAMQAKKYKKAYAAYVAAMQRTTEASRRRDLTRKADDARRAQGKARNRRLLLLFVLLVGGSAAAVWFGQPAAHRWYAERQWAQVDATDEAAVQQFVDHQQAIRAWYLEVVGHYDVAVILQAEEILTKLDADRNRAAVEQEDGSVAENIAAAVANPTLPWLIVQEQAVAAMGQVSEKRRPDIEALLAQVNQAIEAIELDKKQVDDLLAIGQIAEALALAQRVREQPRLGILASGLPVPVRLALSGSDDRPLPPDMKILVDGVALPDGSFAAYRRDDRAVRVEVNIPGYSRSLTTIEPTQTDEIHRIELIRGRAWERSLTIHDVERSWATWHRLASDRWWLIGSKGAIILQASDGTVIGQTQPQTWHRILQWGGQSPLLAHDNAIYQVDEGEGDLPVDSVVTTPGTPLHSEVFESLYRSNVMLRFTLVEGASGYQLEAQEAGQQIWFHDLGSLKRVPQVLIQHGRIAVVGDKNITVYEEDGRELGTLTLPGLRSGPAILFADQSKILIPIVGGELTLIALAERGDPLKMVDAHSQEIDVDTEVLATINSGVAATLAYSSGVVTTFKIGPSGIVPAWSQLINLSDTVVTLVADEQFIVVAGRAGEVLVLDAGDGRVRAAVDHNRQLITAHYAEGRVVTYDVAGVAAAYEVQLQP